MKCGGKVKKYEKGGEVFNKTLGELKKMSPKERRQFERARAYNEGLKNAEKNRIRGSISQTIDQALGPQRGSERKMRKKGYDDMLKAKKAEKKRKAVKKAAGGMLKKPDNPGLKKLPTDVRNKMGYMKKGGKVGYKKGGKVSSCSKRADGIAMKGKTRGRMV